MSTLINANCLTSLPSLNQEIHLTITSPPYNLSETAKKNPVKYNSYKDNLEYNQYLDWLVDVFSLVYDRTVSGGRLAINIGDQKNGQIPVHSDLIQKLQSIGWIPFSTIIWNKRQTRNRAAWGSWMSPSNPSFPSPHEYILIFHKETPKKQTKGETDLTPEEFKTFAYGIWEIAPAKSKVHPAIFPSEIPYRLIKMLSYKHEVVLDPFAGTGTTLIVADSLERYAIGYEIDPAYYQEYFRYKELIGKSH